MRNEIENSNKFIVTKTAANRDHKYVCVCCERKLPPNGYWYVVHNPFKQTNWSTSKKYLLRFVDYTCSPDCADLFILRVL